MKIPSGRNKPAGHTIAKRSLVVAIVLAAGSMLGSCAGASEDGFSAYVADHWPHWAGGMPSDVPPRPGAPGYNQFIAHGQPDQDAMPPAVGAAAVPVKPVFQTAAPAPAAAARQVMPAPVAPSAPPAAQSAPEDSSVVQGGLY